MAADRDTLSRHARGGRLRERRGFGWAHWDYARNFAAYDRLLSPGRWIPEIGSALLD